MKLGILDWGIGGVSLLKRIREKSNMDIIYFSDTGFTPYGKVETEELRVRVDLAIQFLQSRNCDTIALACNAASTVIPKKNNLFGVIEPAVDLVTEMKLDTIGIVGGRRTIESEIYKTRFEKNGMKVKQQIAQPLSARIESGDLHSDELKNEIASIFTPLQEEKNILLACTHYPAISEQIKAFLPNVKLIDPIDRMCEQILNANLNKSGSNSISWITSGNINEMYNAIQMVYGIKPNQIERKNL